MRRAALHEGRRAAVQTPQAAAEITIGQVRAAIAKLPTDGRGAAWAIVTRHLLAAIQEITAVTRNSSPETHPQRIIDLTGKE